MGSRPLLTIITVNLNNVYGLERTAKSVLSQTIRNFEYIIIDGGSTDGSIGVIKSFTGLPPSTFHPSTGDDTGPVISCWVSEKDTGIYNAMNKGIRLAHGEYCQFLNSGDYLAGNEVIEKMMDAFSDCSVFYGNMLKIWSKGRFIRDYGPKGSISMLTFYQATLNHSPAWIKRSLFEKYGYYDETLKIVSDWKWYLIAVGLNNEPVKYINLDITCFDMTGISNSRQELEKKERRKVLEEYLPANVLADYDSYGKKINQANRINSYFFARYLFYFVERALFKYEKWRNKTQR